MMKETKFKGYFVDEFGNVYSNKKGELRKLSQWLTSKGRYYTVKINNTPMLVHRIIAETYILNPYDKPEVDHIDNNSKNNNLDNLQWFTRKENMDKAFLHISPVRNFTNAKLYKDDIFIDDFKSVSSACRFASIEYSISYYMLQKHRSYNGVRIVSDNFSTNKEFGKRGGYDKVLKGRLQEKLSTTTKENPNGIVV